MTACDVEECSRSDHIDYTCSYCKERFCGQHRLPEKHDCIWLRVINTLGPDFRKLDLDDLREDLRVDGNDEMVSLVGEAKRLSQTTEKKEKSECANCKNYTVPDYDLCLRCRRKDKTMSSTSPDVALDGSIKSAEGVLDSPDDNNDDSVGIVTRILGAFKLK